MFTTYLQPECRQTVKISWLSRFGSAAEGASRVRCAAERQCEPAGSTPHGGAHPAEDGASKAAVEPDRLVDTEQPLRATARLGSVVPRLAAGRRRHRLQMERTRRERALRTHSKDSHIGAGRLSASLPPDRLWAPRRLALLDRTRCTSILPIFILCLGILIFCPSVIYWIHPHYFTTKTSLTAIAATIDSYSNSNMTANREPNWPGLWALKYFFLWNVGKFWKMLLNFE